MKLSLLVIALTLVSVVPAAAQRCEPGEEPIVDIEVTDSSLRYVPTENATRPTVCRRNLFTVNVHWGDDSVDSIKLHDFRPLHPRARQWSELDNTGAPDLWHRRHVSFIKRCDAPCVTTKKYNLATSWNFGPNDLVNVRSIQMTIEMQLADGRTVSFPTAWGERP